jgi:hypothetical protein
MCLFILKEPILTFAGCADNDWLGCDKCGQFFHARCLCLNFLEALCEPFFILPMNKQMNYHSNELCNISSIQALGFLPVVLYCGLLLCNLYFKQYNVNII